MSLLVYIPGAIGRPKTHALLEGVGLGPLYDEGDTVEWAEVLDGGPDGGSGLLTGFAMQGVPVHLDRHAQTWHALKPEGDLPAGRAWIGWPNESPPTPDSLARKTQVCGEDLSLADDRDWHIPIARLLPKELGLDGNGRVTAETDRRYKSFYDASWEVFAKFTTTPQGEIVTDWDSGVAYAVSAIAINYRMVRDLAFMLGLLKETHLWAIPRTVCEAYRVAEIIAQKKNANDMPAT